MQPSRPNNDEDDDSHTTLSQGENEAFESCDSSVDLLASPVSRRHEAPPSPAASEPSVISPSTQTLNVLSQHDAVGGGNLRYDMSKMSQDASAVTASQQVQLSERNDFCDWTMTTVTLTKPGPLGMTVRRLTLENPTRSYAMINNVKPKSQAEKAGVLPGDIVGAKYDEVKEWSKGPRPLIFCILRKPSDGEKDNLIFPVATNRLVAASSSSASTSSASSSPAMPKSSGQTAKKPAPKSTPKAATTERTANKDTSVNTTNASTTDTTTNTQADQQAAVLLAHKLATTLLPPESGGTFSAASHQDKPMPDSSSPPADDTVSFCKSCQKPNSTSRAHHALCPQHPHFENSGALQKLQLIRRGVDMGCEACKHFYQNGRIVDPTIIHIDKCPRRKQPLRQNGEILVVNETATSVEKNQGGGTAASSKSRSKGGAVSKKNTFVSGTTEKSTKSTSKKKAVSGKAAAGKKTGTTKKRGNTVKKTAGQKSSTGRGSQSATIASSNPASQDTSTDARIHQSTQDTFGSTVASSTGRRTRKKPRYEYESDSDSEVDFDGKENMRPSSMRSVAKRTKFVEKDSAVPIVVEKKQLVALAPKKKTTKKKGPPQVSKSNVDTQMKPSWVPCANPWGPSGYQEGDVVLVTPSGGFTNHETIYGGDRFTVSPFGSDSDYDNTHRTPSEGFDVILLTRDPNAEHPWGFTYRRHEFGGACLVASVDALSPAASAVRTG